MMTCVKCGVEKDESLFITRAGQPRMPCKACQALYYKDYYAARKDEHNRRRYKNAKESRKRGKAFATEIKNAPCTDCGIRYPPWVMQFDHLRDKKENVSALTGRGASIERITEEISKCELVCANCHADGTYKRRNPGLSS